MLTDIGESTDGKCFLNNNSHLLINNDPFFHSPGCASAVKELKYFKQELSEKINNCD